MKIYCSVISLRVRRSCGLIVESSSALCRPRRRRRHCRRCRPRSPLACFSQRAKLCALPLLIRRCNWKRLALCAGLRPQRFCLHVGREIPTCTHTLKSGVPLYHDPTSQVRFYTDVLAAAERGRREWTPVCPGEDRPRWAVKEYVRRRAGRNRFGSQSDTVAAVLETRTM